MPDETGPKCSALYCSAHIYAMHLLATIVFLPISHAANLITLIVQFSVLHRELNHFCRILFVVIRLKCVSVGD